MKLPLPILSSLALATVCLSPTRAKIDYVIAISIDGGRGDFIETFIETAPTEFPNFKRLRDLSACTFNARCDYSQSITIPDHLCMLTGRPVSQPSGLAATVPHGVTTDSPGTSDTVHNSGSNIGVYKASIFDVVHDRGLSTALYMGKTRLTICERSWNSANGAADTIGADNGKAKIDFSHILEAQNAPTSTPTLLSEFVATIQAGTLRNFTLWHVADTDYAGHNNTWNSSSGSVYRTTMATADGWIGQILNAVQNNTSLNGRVALMLTADHGGGGASPANTHTDATLQGNYTIPFFLMAPGLPGGSNLYDALDNRFDPGSARPTYTDTKQPVRNGDVANLASALLGLPAVPNSLMVANLKQNLTVARTDTAITVEWPLYLTGWTLAYTDDLAATSWQAVPGAITEGPERFTHTVSLPHPEKRFFRLTPPAGP